MLITITSDNLPDIFCLKNYEGDLMIWYSYYALNSLIIKIIYINFC